jgi:hypothetical protein
MCNSLLTRRVMEDTMRRTLISLLIGTILSIPVTVLADCAEVITVGQGPGKQICFLTAEYTVNGVLFCEYECELVMQ